MTRLAILCTHPIQYYAPVFAKLSQQPNVTLKVFYGWKGLVDKGLDRGFGKEVTWDVPLLEGYEFEFLDNVARDPGSHHFHGIDCPKGISSIDAWRPDAILVYGWSYKTHLKALRTFHGRIPVLFRGDSTLLDPMPRWKQLIRRLRLHWIYRHVDYALYVGQNNRAYYRAMGLAENQLVFVPHAIDNDRFAPSLLHDQQARAFRQSLGIPDGERVLMFVGKLEPKKSPELLLSAFENAKALGLSLVFVGSGQMEEQLRKRAVAGVFFAGFRNQMELPGVYAAADVVALPSAGPGETWGLAINEGMAAGRAIIASRRVGCAVDLVRPNDNGWIFSVNDLGNLTSLLREVATMSDERLESFKARSRALIADWSLDCQVDSIDGLLSQLRSRIAR